MTIDPIYIPGIIVTSENVSARKSDLKWEMCVRLKCTCESWEVGQ